MAKTTLRRKKYKSFDLQPGRKIGAPYEVVRKLGEGTEGEVYQILETDTGIHRAAKVYYEHKDPKSRTVVWYARKLNKLRSCPIVLHYHHTQMIQVAGRKVLCVISELCDGLQLEQWVKAQRGGRLPPYVAFHVLHQLARGLEWIHGLGEYHADVHSQNILIRPEGIGFDLRLVDFYNWGRPSKEKQQQDIVDAVQVFFEMVGGREHYHKMGPQVRQICAGQQRGLILKRFPRASALRFYLETFEWHLMP